MPNQDLFYTQDLRVLNHECAHRLGAAQGGVTGRGSGGEGGMRGTWELLFPWLFGFCLQKPKVKVQHFSVAGAQMYSESLLEQPAAPKRGINSVEELCPSRTAKWGLKWI